MGGWQDIATAPHNSEDVLLWRDGWLKPVMGWSAPGAPVTEWQITASRHVVHYPTHWMPLPSPPEHV